MVGERMLATDAKQHLAEMQVRMQTPCMVYTSLGLDSRAFVEVLEEPQLPKAQGNGLGGMRNQSQLMLAWPDAQPGS